MGSAGWECSIFRNKYSVSRITASSRKMFGFHHCKHIHSKRTRRYLTSKHPYLHSSPSIPSSYLSYTYKSQTHFFSLLAPFPSTNTPFPPPSYITIPLPLPPIHQPPSPQRQPLQLHHRGPNKSPKRHNPHNHTNNISNIIPIPFHNAGACSLETRLFLCFQTAGKGGGDEVAFEGGGEVFGRVEGRRRVAGCEGEVVDEFEDEEAGEGAAEVGDAGFVSCLK